MILNWTGLINGPKRDATNEMLEKLNSLRKNDNPPCEYARLQKFTTTRFNDKHLFRSTPEATKFRSRLADYFEQILLTKPTTKIAGIKIEDFLENFAPHLPAKSSWRMRGLIQRGVFKTTTKSAGKILSS